MLIYTLSLEELILNCVALEVIIALDEYIFEAFAPSHVRRVFEERPRLAFLTWPRFHGVDMIGCFSFFAMIGALTFFVVEYLQPQVEVLVRARDAICAGDQDFVFTVDGAGVPAWTYPQNFSEDYHMQKLEERNFPDGGSSKRTHTVQSELPASSAERLVDVLLQQMGRPYHSDSDRCNFTMCYKFQDFGAGLRSQRPLPNAPPCCQPQKMRAPQVEPGPFSLVGRSQQTFSDAVRMVNPSCYDVLDLPGGATPLMKTAMGDAADWRSCGQKCPETEPLCFNGICIDPVCADVKSYCSQTSVAGLRARQLCPLTCGCHLPRSTLALALPEDGCGKACWRYGGYLENLEELPCKDVDRDDPAFLGFLDAVNQARASWSEDRSIIAGLYVRYLKLQGCEAINRTSRYLLFNTNICVEAGSWSPIKPLSYFCPVTCGCRKGDAHCPNTCPERKETEPPCLPKQRDLNFPRHTCPMSA